MPVQVATVGATTAISHQILLDITVVVKSDMMATHTYPMVVGVIKVFLSMSYNFISHASTNNLEIHN